MFVLPPTNHFENGRSHSRTVFHFSNQSSSDATSDQNRSGSAAARARIDSYSSAFLMWALEENSLSGGKVLCSLNNDSMLVSAIQPASFPFLAVYCKKNKKAAGFSSAAF